jgi:hypothetical protein
MNIKGKEYGIELQIITDHGDKCRMGKRKTGTGDEEGKEKGLTFT